MFVVLHKIIGKTILIPHMRILIKWVLGEIQFKNSMKHLQHSMFIDIYLKYV